MSQELNYLGVPIFFAGKTWYIPSLSIAQFQTHYDALTNPPEATDKKSVKKRFDIFIPIIGAALRRNYPELTDDVLWDHLDLETFTFALRAVQGASGLKAVRQGEAESQTEP